MNESVESLVAYCRENDRVCPLPPLWSRLWEMLPGRSRVGVGWQPAPPLILAAWHDTPAMLKMLRLAEHIEWAVVTLLMVGLPTAPVCLLHREPLGQACI